MPDNSLNKNLVILDKIIQGKKETKNQMCDVRFAFSYSQNLSMIQT